MERTKLIATGLALALVSISAPAMAAGPAGHGPPGEEGGFPGLPTQALFGICTAFGHADTNATANAGPFTWLTSPMCEDTEPPADRSAEDAEDDSDEETESSDDERAPRRAGPPR